MYYQIHVKMLGDTLFSTSGETITTLSRAMLVYFKLSSVFTKKDGYDVSVSVCNKEDITESINKPNQ